MLPTIDQNVLDGSGWRVVVASNVSHVKHTSQICLLHARRSQTVDNRRSVLITLVCIREHNAMSGGIWRPNSSPRYLLQVIPEEIGPSRASPEAIDQPKAHLKRSVKVKLLEALEAKCVRRPPRPKGGRQNPALALRHIYPRAALVMF